MHRPSFWISAFGFALFMVSAAPAAEPQPEDFVIVKDGHLHRHGKRVRYWATNLLFVDDKYHKERHSTNYESIDAGIERLKKLGYNAVRYWVRGMGDFENYKKSDRSKADYSDYFLARLKEEGFVIWQAGLNDKRDPRMVTAADVGVIDDPSTAKEWIAAVSEKPKPLGGYRARAWDPRLRKLNLRQVKKYLDHYNQYTKLYAYEDPVYAVWELTNEEWWTQKMLRSEWLNEPEYFRQELIQQWNDWLKDKYKTTSNLRRAWGKLREGESLENKSVTFAPMAEDVDARPATLKSTNPDKEEKQILTKDQCSTARYEDVERFLLEISVTYKREIERFIRSYGKKGIGCQIVPILWDTGFDSMRMIEPSLDLYSRSSSGSVFGYYLWINNKNKKDPRFPWKSLLTGKSIIYYSWPWVERNRKERKPLFVYEQNIGNPSKYRAEVPYLMAVVGSLNDWDWISWYQFDGFRRIDKDGDPNPYSRTMNYENDDHYWNGIAYIFDEVLQASMTGAGEIFTTFSVQPRRIGSYKTDKGPVFKPTNQITIDTEVGSMLVDTPTAKAVGGFLPDRWEFSDGVTLENIQVHNPEGQPFVIDGERFAIVYLVAKDAQPLAESKKILLTAMSTSFREGFSINMEAYGREELEKNWWGAPRKEVFQQAKFPGGRRAKNLVSRVGLTVRGNFLKGKHWKMYDWELKVIASGTVKGEEFTLPTNKDVTFVIFTENTENINK